MKREHVRFWAAGGIAFLAMVILLVGMATDLPSPTPAPPGPQEFSLRGKFSGSTASSDAAALAGLCDELAACLEFDGSRELAEQRIRTGAQIEDLRIASRELRMRGESLGARQPAAREAIRVFLDDAAGDFGGPLTPEQRARWIAAFRAVARAAADAAQ